jgi:hypothetical protein
LRAKKIEPGDLLDRPRTRNNITIPTNLLALWFQSGGEAALETAIRAPSVSDKNVSNAQRSIHVAALPYGGHFFDPCVARCRGCNDSGSTERIYTEGILNCFESFNTRSNLGYQPCGT